MAAVLHFTGLFHTSLRRRGGPRPDACGARGLHAHAPSDRRRRQP